MRFGCNVTAILTEVPSCFYIKSMVNTPHKTLIGIIIYLGGRGKIDLV